MIWTNFCTIRTNTMKLKLSPTSYSSMLFIVTFSANSRMVMMTDEVPYNSSTSMQLDVLQMPQSIPASDLNHKVRSAGENHGTDPRCKRCRMSSSMWLAGSSDLRDSTILLLGDNMGEALQRLSRCARRRRVLYSLPSSIPSLLQQVTQRHFNRHQLLLHVHKQTAMDSAAMVQLLKSAYLLYGGFSLIFAPGLGDSGTQQKALLFAHGCRPAVDTTPCRWLTDPTPLLKEAMRLNRKRQLLNLFAAGQCEKACKLSNSSSPSSHSSFSVCDSRNEQCGQKKKSILVKHQNSTEDILDQLAKLWCQGTGHTIIDFRAKPQRKKTTDEKWFNSFELSDLLPLKVRHYDKNRPPKYKDMPTEVYYHVTVISLDSIDEASMTFVTDIFLAQSWRDDRLRMPVNMTENYRILDVSYLQHIWRPDLFFKNAKQVTFHEMTVPNHYLWFYKDKTLLYMTKLTLVLSCAMKFQRFPHDTQSCSMMMESLSHTTDDVVFLWNHTDPLLVNPDIELPQLDITRNTTEDCTLTYSTGNFTCLAVRFHLKRRLGYHLFHSYIPSALIVVMSWISFWIKPEAIPARVTLGITSLLILATQNQQTQQSLPPVSYVKAVDVWMSSCSVFIFSTLMEYAVVNHFMGPISHRATATDSQDDLAYLTGKTPRIGLFARLVQFRGGGKVITSRQPQYTTIRYGREVALRFDRGSRICFPLCFFLFNVGYWTKYINI